MPVLGLTMEEGAVAEWLKAPGDAVIKDEPLFTVEMDKGIVEVPAPASGILRSIQVPPGQTVAVKTLLAEIAPAGEAAPASVPPERSRSFASPRARMRAREHGVSLDSVTGSGPRGRIVEADVLTALREPLPAARAAATPLARRLAAEQGLDLHSVAGSGPGGRITQEDVQRAAGVRTAVEPSPEVAPLSRLRQITAARMSASAHSVARVTMFVEVDFEEASRLRAQLSPEFARLGVPKLPWDAILARAAGLALMEHPAVNAQWVEGQGLRRHMQAHVGVAVALDPEGLVVPVLRDAAGRSLRQLAADLLALTEQARSGRLAASDMQGGTFTITNLGGYGIDGFTPIINPPETAVLGVGRIAERATVVDHRIQVRTTCTLSLSFDHRVVDGAPAAAFLQRLAQLLERPYALLEM